MSDNIWIFENMFEIFINLKLLLLTGLPLILIGALTWIYFYSTRNFDYWKKRNIDGPTGLPFMGSYFSLTTPMAQLQMKYIRKYGKIFGAFRFHEPFLYIADPEVIKRILVRDFYMFSDRPNKTADKYWAVSLTNIKGEPWKRIRSIITPLFTSAKLRKMEPLMDSCVQSVLNTFERCALDKTQLCVFDTMGHFTMDVIAKCAFATDISLDPNNTFVRQAQEFFTVFSVNAKRLVAFYLLPYFFHRFLRSTSSTYFIDLAKHLIAERKKDSSGESYEDMLQLMINAELKDNSKNQVDEEDLLEAHHVNVGSEEIENEKVQLKVASSGNANHNNKLTEDEMISQSRTFLLAGYETTAATMTSCIYELAMNPDVQERLYDEIQKAKITDPTLSYRTLQALPYLDAVITETMRRHPQVVDLIRECTADEVHIPEINYTLKRKDFVIIPVYAIHHTEEYYPEPYRFNPDRFLPENRDKLKPYTYLPFGGGPRNCIGMRFALTEIKLGLANILDRYVVARTDKTPDPPQLKVSYRFLKTEPIYVGVKKR